MMRTVPPASPASGEKSRWECGQALLFFAIVLPALLLALGVVVEGGYVMDQYRLMQSAADMAALVGAQALPCNTGDTGCIGAAERRACTYAARNGFPGCVPAATGSNSASVPPLSCSPYDFVNYGNNGINPSCKSATAPLSSYAFIEVRLYFPLQVPIFGTAVTLYAHAVARNGQISPKRFAIIVLDSSMSKALSFSGAQGGGLVAVGPVVSDSTAADSIYTGGQSTQVACSGQWYTAANEIVGSGGPAANLTSNTGGTTWFAPPVCTGGVTDNPTNFVTNQANVPDPYTYSAVPTAATLNNCLPCQSTAYFYTWTTGSRSAGTWGTANNLPAIGNGTNIELFPGVYPTQISITGGQVYMNPGVYTLQAGMNQNGGNICIYGAPTCDAQVNLVNPLANCSTASFRTTDATYVPSGAWYYYCSPWGIWDSTNLPNRPAAEPTTAPTFTNGGPPLNGVTLYVQAGNLVLNGNGAEYLAFPNPCPGTGTSATTASPPTVQFPDGAASASYAYPGGSLAATDGILYSPTGANGTVYPNADMSLGAECSQSLPPTPELVWDGEVIGQHFHFLIFTRSTTSSISLNGTGLQNFWGILYSPGAQGCGSKCQVSLNGSGGGGTGPPLLTGEIIADNASFSGNAAFEVFYSPCSPTGNVCLIGYGTSLVE